MYVVWDVVEGAGLRIVKGQKEIVRACMVCEIPIDCSVGFTDPAVLNKALSVLPGQYSQHPTDPTLFLEDFDLRAIKSTDSIIVGLVYRTPATTGGGGALNVWTKLVDTQAYQVESYQTAKGGKNLIVAYKSAAANPIDNTPPASWFQRTGKVKVWKTNKLLKFVGRMRYDVWMDTYNDSIVELEEKINKTAWGGRPRGSFLYLGSRIEIPLLYANPDAISIATIELNFLHDKKAHFPMVAYFNERREHPKDASTEAVLRAKGLPAEDDITLVNGKILASTYEEGDFNGKFPFDP